MNCLPCFNKDDDEEEVADPQQTNAKKDNPAQLEAAKEASSSKAQTFNFRELAMATKNFRQECLLGEGGFGRVFKGKLHASGKVVAVKQLDRNGMQGNKEFLVEVLMLSLIQHPNLVSLIGYCADGDQRLLVYEYMEMGSVENHLFGDNSDKKPLDWYTRMKIASGAASGLEYLHEKANPPIIYRDLKPSNILLEENYEPKLSDYGLAKLGAAGGKVNPTSRVMGTYGYSAPEYSSGGELTLKSDIYSFGVVLLELISGRRAIDTTRPNDEQNLVTWAQPIFREPKRFPDLADPRLNNNFPVTSLNQAVGICAMCLQEEPSVRPLISDVIDALSFLAIPQPSTNPALVQPENSHSPPSEQRMQYDSEIKQNQSSHSDKDSSSCDDDRSSEESESSGDDYSTSDHRNEGSSQTSSGEKDSSTLSSERGSERQDSNRRHSFDNNSEEQSTYSDSDSEGDNTNYDDAETSEVEDSGTRSTNSSTNYSLYSAKSTGSSLKSDSGNKSSANGSSRRSTPTKDTGSRQRKPVVTFKEPSLSAKKNGTRPEGGKCSSDNLNSNNNQTATAATGTDGRQHQSSSSSSSEESSDSEDEEPPRHKEVAKVSRTNDSKDNEEKDGYKNNHRVFDESEKEVPKLRHLKTR
ncbi:unnamed protein product [Amaranthus hypochondriacus]